MSLSHNWPTLATMTAYANRERLVILDADGTTIDAFHAIEQTFLRHGIDIGDFDYVAFIPLRGDKVIHLKRARENFSINPARAYACGDEYGDYQAAIGAGMHPFVVAYGFEDSSRLTRKFGVPLEVISTSPAAFAERLLHALDLASYWCR